MLLSLVWLVGSPDNSWSVNLITKIGGTALTLYAGCSIANEVYSNQGDVYVSNLLNVGLLAAGIICGPTVGLAIGIGYFFVDYYSRMGTGYSIDYQINRMANELGLEHGLVFNVKLSF